MEATTRVKYWEDWTERLTSLRNEVELAIEDFAPYGKRADKDAPAVTALFDMLGTVSSFSAEREDEAHAEEERMYDAWDMFRAWELGLCPKAMKACQKDYGYVYDAGNSDNWEEISSYLQDEEMSEGDTLQAVTTWQAQRYKEAV